MVHMSIGLLPGKTRAKTLADWLPDGLPGQSRRVFSWGAVCCGLLLLTSTNWLSAQVQDQVFESGTPTRCSILSVSRDSLRVSDKGQQREIPINTIRKIVFGNEPNELKTARDRIRDGRYEDALALLKKIDVASVKRDLVQRDVAYLKALVPARLAMSTSGDKKRAHDALLGFFKINKQSHHYYEAAQVLGDLSMSQENYEAAAGYYAAIAKAPWEDYQMRALVLQARAQLAQGGFDAALASFEKVGSSAGNTPVALDQKLEAAIGKAVCLAEKGQAEEGLQIVQKVISENDYGQKPAVFARAYNALGRCHLASKKPKEALLAFLHVHLLPKLRSADADAHAEALYHLGKLWAQVNQPDRAVKATSLLKSRYAGSVWASKKG
ncbi:MAG: tetratricopeptide repeat protein [Planctomycetota bacterium]|nr:tetratricopeptide repeat protein [Planctomycetota bacterium]